MRGASPALLHGLIGAGVLAIAAVMYVGAGQISSEAGYSGIGPNFLPLAVAAALGACGAWLLWEALTGGFRNAEEASGAAHGDWVGFAWVSAGLLANALLITRIGFVFSCALCFVLAARGLRLCEGRPAPVPVMGRDALVGLAIAAPTYWTFTKLLAINLPGLTSSGWI